MPSNTRGFKTTMKLYQAIARKLAAIRNCEQSGNTEWKLRHREELNGWIKEHLPSGSGFDNGSTLNEDKSTPGRLVFDTAFHHMNEHGYYCGWSDHQVIITPSFQFGFDLRVTGRNVRDIKGYIAECFQFALDDTDVDCF
jgi:hypothetical protein